MRSFLTCAALVVAVIVVPCQARSMERTDRVTVDFTDLDVSRPAGAAVLLSRLKTAADVACRGGVNTLSLDAISRSRQCADAALANAVRAVGNPVVAGLYGKPLLVAHVRPTQSRSVTFASNTAH